MRLHVSDLHHKSREVVISVGGFQISFNEKNRTKNMCIVQTELQSMVSSIMNGLDKGKMAERIGHYFISNFKFH